MEKLTPSQQRAVAARGNVLVMAGAGTGKTHTLVARCLNLICGENISLDEILIVTFTEAAAAEMKQRLRVALEKKSRVDSGSHLAEQLALFDAAHIGTLHSFCFKLVREHFHELGLDPQLSILDEGQARLLADETLEEQFNSHYENKDEFSLAFQELIKIYGSGRDENIRKLVLYLHHYIQTRADAENWPARQIEIFSSVEPVQWREWFDEAISNWRAEWLPVLGNLRAENPKAAECLEILKSRSADIHQEILAADANWPRGTKKFRGPLEDFFDDTKFLDSLAATGKNDPLAEDWNWIRGHMKTLLQLVREFSEQFSAHKRGDGVLDFHDLERFTLKLLWDFETERPTPIAERWREKLRFVFVDEYQDINAAQNKIISALARDRKKANRFLVGDVKQSIYRFRLAEPKIFRAYAQSWPTIPLAENFRSRAPILNFVNSLFAPLMREEIGGVDFNDEAKLKAARGEVRSDEARPNAELLLRLKSVGNENVESENGDELVDLDESEKEARMLAQRLLELKTSGHEIEDAQIFRPVEWRDMVILLRSPSGKAEVFAKQFERAGVPLVVERGGFYDSSEIQDLLSLLKLLDNPLQDVPCIAVLRSPLVGCSLDELAEIRLLQTGKFWFALNQIENPKAKVQNYLRTRVKKFLERFSRWRKMAKQASLSQCLEEILAETHYDDWLQSRPRGAQKYANVRQFLHLAEQFDQFQRQGLFRFLKFIEAQREIEAEPEVAPVVEENAVRLMSIHQSKGLEFPVVAVADLGKNFNERDLRGEIILDERFGLCPRVKPPAVGGRYPSLALWLAQKNQRRELRGEELRLLYVALTRARDMLILTAGISKKKWETVWTEPQEITPQKILGARSFTDWIGLWFGVCNPQPTVRGEMRGELPNLRWRIFADEELAGARVPHTESGVSPDFQNGSRRDAENGTPEARAPQTLKNLRGILDWKYKFESATKQAAKSSVTALRRETNAELEEEAEKKFSVSSSQFSAKRRAAQKPQLSAVDAGIAAHKFLQHFEFESATGLKPLEVEADRLAMENYLSADERRALDLKSIGKFWDSDVGRKILSQKKFIRRELPFTAKFSPQELDKILGVQSPADLNNEFVVVQGVADLVVLLPKEIWIVDFKTDKIRGSGLAEKTKIYAPQLKLYAQALEKIYSRPVTKPWLHFLSARRTVEI